MINPLDLFAWIDIPSFILGIFTLLGLQVAAVVWLWKRYIKVAQDPEAEQRAVETIIEEYDKHARGSK